MKSVCFAILLKLALFSSEVLSLTPDPSLKDKTAFINEFHYSNKGEDVEEFIEVAVPSYIDDISDYKLELYSGKFGKMYKRIFLSAAEKGKTLNGLTFYQVEAIEIRNGGDKGDGIALVNSAGVVLEFISYEGSFTAKSGSAEGLVSTPIGVAESGVPVETATPVGFSLQLGGRGCSSAEFKWQAALEHTFGTVNRNQVIDCGIAIPVPPTSESPVVFINEFHYENSGKDETEFIEVAYEEGLDLDLYSLELYNGDKGIAYMSLPLADATVGATLNGLSFCYVDEAMFQGKLMQNGAVKGKSNRGDGLALVDPDGKVLQFLSYEGSIKPIRGSAAGMRSVDIGVNEQNAPPGTSLQLGGTGCSYNNFTWQRSKAQTMGNVNVGQTIVCKEKIIAPPEKKNPPKKNSSPPTYIPGEASIVENDLLLSTGLTARVIAREGRKVDYVGGGKSEELFHMDPDGAAVFKDRAPNLGGWIYVSNSEESKDGGVGALTFNSDGEVIGYKRILRGTRRNCGGGKTFYDTWITCEETGDGQIYEVDPWGNLGRKTIMGIPSGDKYESAAYDNRDENNPYFLVTVDSEFGAIQKFTPDKKAVKDAVVSGDYRNLLHSNETYTAKIEFLMLNPNFDKSGGTFRWTDNLDGARQNANRYYQKSEGIDIRDGKAYITCKKGNQLIILDLDDFTYTASSTKSGAFNNQPDQVARLLGEGAEDILYFCEDGSTGVCGVHGRDSTGNYYTILEGKGLPGETTGLSFSPDNRRMYVSFQKPGFIYEITRTDGYSFGGRKLDIKYHSEVPKFKKPKY